MGTDSKSGDWSLSMERRLVIGRFGKFSREICQLTNHHAELKWPVTTFRVPIILRDWLPLGATKHLRAAAETPAKSEEKYKGNRIAISMFPTHTSIAPSALLPASVQPGQVHNIINWCQQNITVNPVQSYTKW